MIYVTKNEKKEKLAHMKARIAEYDRIGDVAMREQAKRDYSEAKDTWAVRNG